MKNPERRPAQETLHGFLRELQACTSDEQPSPALERRLLEAWRAAEHPGRPDASGRRPSPWTGERSRASRAPWYWGGLAVAALVAVALVARPLFDHGSPGTEATRVSDVVEENDLGRASGDFVALSYEPFDQLDSVQVVHVRLPVSALASMGWTSAERWEAERVEAEVVLGPDGVARAIRLLD